MADYEISINGANELEKVLEDTRGLEEVKDKDNFLYTLSAPGRDRFHHYTMFTSCKETFGYPTPEAWFAYMREWKEELQHPVQIKIKN